MDGDLVAIEILPEDEWERPSDIVLEDKAEDPGKSLSFLRLKRGTHLRSIILIPLCSSHPSTF